MYLVTVATVLDTDNQGQGTAVRFLKQTRLGCGPAQAAVPKKVGQMGRRGNMSEVAYVSEVRIERVQGVLRRAYLPAEQEPVLFGVHGAVAAHYGITPELSEPHATTLDYIVAAAAG